MRADCTSPYSLLFCLWGAGHGASLAHTLLFFKPLWSLPWVAYEGEVCVFACAQACAHTCTSTSCLAILNPQTSFLCLQPLFLYCPKPGHRRSPLQGGRRRWWQGVGPSPSSGRDRRRDRRRQAPGAVLRGAPSCPLGSWEPTSHSRSGRRGEEGVAAGRSRRREAKPRRNTGERMKDS